MEQGDSGAPSIDAGSRGTIVNIASVSGFIAQPEFVPYNCSKGAVLQLTKCCAMDLAEDKVGAVNAVNAVNVYMHEWTRCGCVVVCMCVFEMCPV